MSKHLNDEINKRVGENIRNLRHQRGWRMGFVASELGIAISAYSKIENGVTDIFFSTLENIAGLFEITVIELLSPGLRVSQSHDPDLYSMEEEIFELEKEVARLQRMLISLYEEIRKNKQAPNEKSS